MSELGTMKPTVIKVLKRFDALAVENSVHVGTPDVNYIEGWLELKWLRSWPVKADTIVRLEHYTPQQRVWLMRRWVNGGKAHLLLQCRSVWLLFNGDVAAEHVGRVSRSELERLACWKTEVGLEKDSARFIEHLRMQRRMWK